jgi:elongator complex protein 2
MAMVQAVLEHVAAGCNAATNALSVAADSGSSRNASSSYCSAFAARNVVCLLRSSSSSEADDSDAAPLAIVETLKHREATSDASRLTSVQLYIDTRSGDARVLAGDSESRVLLWTRTSDGGWRLRCLSDETSSVAVAAVAITETSRRWIYVVACSDGTLKVFGENKTDGEEVKLASRVELGVKSIMEAIDTVVVKCGEREESVLLATGGVDGKVHLFELAGGDDELKKVLQLEGHRDWVRSLAFQEKKIDVGEGTAVMLASASQDQRVRLWKLTARAREDGKDTGSGEVKDGFLAHGCYTTYTVSFDALLVGHEDWVTSVQWMWLPREDASEPALLSSSMDNTLIVWTKPGDSRTSWSPSLRVGEVGGNGLLSAGVLPGRGGRLSLISLGFGGQLERWEQQPAPSRRFLPAISVNGHCAEVTDLAWSPRGDYLASVSLDQTTRVLAPSMSSKSKRKNWYEVSRGQVHGYDINCACFVLGDRPTNDQFVSGADEKVLRVFEAPDEVKQRVAQLTGSGKDTGREAQEGSGSQARAVQHAYLPELSLTNKSAQTEEAATGQERGDGYAALNKSVSLPVGDTLGRKTLWPEQRKLYGHGNELLSVASSHAGDLVASACKSREERYAAVRLWNTTDWSEAQQPLEGHKSSVVQLAFSPDDKFLLSVSRDRQFCLYQREQSSDPKFSLVQRVKAHRRIIWSCSWSPDSSVFALGSRDQSFSLWGQSGGNWDRICDPIAVEAAVTAVAFAPCELPSVVGPAADPAYLLAVGLETGAIRFFTVSKFRQEGDAVQCTLTGELAWELAPSSAIMRLAWAPDAPPRKLILAAASSDSSVRVYTVKI